MPARGTPDGGITPYTFASQVTDLGAIYQMLWGFAPIDSQGRPMFLDTFNNGLNGWALSHTGAGLDPVLVTPANYVFSPPNCAKLDAGTVANDLSYMFREIYAGKTFRLGIEAGFQFSAGYQPRLRLDYNPISGSPYLGTIVFSQSLGQWQIIIAGGGTVAFYSPGSPTSNMLMQIKLVCDFQTGKYSRAFIGDQDFDLSAYSLQASSSAYNGLLIANAANVSKGAGAGAMQLGYVLVTKDEP